MRPAPRTGQGCSELGEGLRLTGSSDGAGGVTGRVEPTMKYLAALSIINANRDESPMSLIFYTRPDCGLCDKAEALLAETGMRSRYEKVDIESDLDLIARYGDQVPVLLNDETGEKLAWPFTASQARALIDD